MFIWDKSAEYVCIVAVNVLVQKHDFAINVK